MSIKTPATIKPPVTIETSPDLRIARPANATTLYGDGRYYLSIRTAPHAGWEHPAGWRWDSLAAARRGAAEADRRWMAVRLTDGATGELIEWS